ncbi:glycosyl hydrolase [Halalkalicoccus sp. NIPERK01]|uniref:glycosyl hydrolase n=1 Tax=Halalkalicoccus sp. NIPERK01 TaxID=3053469 RepID=UPI00256F5122|nr:glycosyl hydrolase [Halalkalicoccus sp. NIPERK01]MDL5360617.1 glycosyl hydrolase [Halalkalicoccus sp. NIPERK01]
MTRVKLEGISDGRIDATANGTLLREGSEGRGKFDRVGRIPNPAAGTERLRHGLVSSEPWKPLLERVVGAFSAGNVWRLSETALLSTTGRWLLASHDGGRSWSVRRTLPDSSGPKGVLPTAVCRHAGEVYLGEYPLDHGTVPKLLRSRDDGWTWEIVGEFPGVRHLHSVRSDPYTDDLWITTGDRDEACRIGRFREGVFEVVGGGSQRWRAVELAFTPTHVLWGMDSVYSPENHVLRLDRTEVGRSNPEPETVHTLGESVFYSAALDVDDERWVVLSTSVEPGSDSTAPPGSPRNDASGRARVVAASSASNFAEWHELAAYRRRRTLGEFWNPCGVFPRSSAYVHLAADPERGVVLNPYNTASADGSLVVIPPSRFAALSAATTDPVVGE